MPKPLLHVPEYATAAQRPGRPDFTPVAYLAYCAAAVTFTAMLVGPLLLAARMKRIYDDFGMKLPAVSQVVLDVAGALVGAGVAYWVWILPALAPLLLLSLEPRTRSRALLTFGVLAVLLCAVEVIAVYLPMLTLAEGLTNQGGAR